MYCTIVHTSAFAAVIALISSAPMAFAAARSFDKCKLVHRSIAHAVAGVQKPEDGGLYPHAPSRLLLRGNARRYMVRKLAKSPRWAPRLAALRSI